MKQTHSNEEIDSIIKKLGNIDLKYKTINDVRLDSQFNLKKSLYCSNDDFINQIESSKIDIDIKTDINKRTLQLNNKIENIQRIANVLRGKSTLYFIKAFCNKLIEQGETQVNLNNDSYMTFSLLFYCIYTDELFIYFKHLVFNLAPKSEKIKGIYMIYIGILLLKGKFKDLEDLLNSLESKDEDLYILYSLLYVCKDTILTPVNYTHVKEVIKNSTNVFLKAHLNKLIDQFLNK